MNYKPFDLEAARAGKPLITGDGTPAKFIAHVPESEYPVVVVIDNVIYTLKDDGVWLDRTLLSRCLFMAPEKKTVWVNIYSEIAESWRGCTHCVGYPTKKDADDNCDYNRTACVEVAYEEGQGL